MSSTCPWMPICIATIGSKITPRIGQPIRYAADPCKAERKSYTVSEIRTSPIIKLFHLLKKSPNQDGE